MIHTNTTTQISIEEFKNLVKGSKKNKYSNKHVQVAGVKYDSVKESEYADYLNLLKHGKEIISYEYHKDYPIFVNGERICYYEADFSIINKDGSEKIVDIKGYTKVRIMGKLQQSQAYAMFRLKKKLFHAVYNKDIVEVKKVNGQWIEKI